MSDHDQRNTHVWAIEIKRALSPKSGKGFHIACKDLKPSLRFVVYSGLVRYPINTEIEATGLKDMAVLLADLCLPDQYRVLGTVLSDGWSTPRNAHIPTLTRPSANMARLECLGLIAEVASPRLHSARARGPLYSLTAPLLPTGGASSPVRDSPPLLVCNYESWHCNAEA